MWDLYRSISLIAMGSPGMVALEPGDLDFQRNLPQGVDGSSFRLVQLPNKRCWEAARQLCPALGPPVPPVPSVPSVPSGLPEVAMQLASPVDEAEVISVEDEEPQPEASLREAVPSLREAAPSLTLGESMHQIVEIDPEECQQAESIPKEQHLREPAGPPAQVMPLAEAETVMEGFGGLGGSAQVDQFGPQARAAFRPPRGREAETAEAPTLQGQPFAMAPVVPAAFQGCDGSLLGPAARHQFKKPRVLATPARAVSSFNPIGEGATTLNAAAPKLPQSTAGLICSAADLLRAHREHREHRV